ncbi:HNH endonuclease [Rummeliibacillus sp. JY-2-4R]
MSVMKGNANADKLFKLLLSFISNNTNYFRKEYTVSEIGTILSKESSGLLKAESYNYAMTSMFSGQKRRDYFIFKKNKVKDEFTKLVNDANRNNHSWKNIYGNEIVQINPLYLQDIFPYSQINTIRILPMSNNDPEFKNKNISEVQGWFEDVLPNRIYNFKKGMNAGKGTLVLFQYEAHIIAAAILDSKIMYESVIDGGYSGYYKFIPSSIAIFPPLNDSDMKSVWKDFIGFKNSQQNLNIDGYKDFMFLLIEKNIQFSMSRVDEDAYQDDIEKMEVNSFDVEDKPVNPMKISRGKEKQHWLRSGVTAKKAIMLASYKCEYDQSHTYFNSKVTGQNYVEAHHLVPMEYQDKFKYSLDVEANIVSLCPICHKRIHHATLEEKKQIVEELYNSRKDRLRKCGIRISLRDLITYYS